MTLNRTNIITLALLVSLTTLTGCKKFWGLDDSDSKKKGDTVSTAPSPSTYGLTGVVTGLDGSVTLKWADQQKVLDANGDFTIADVISDASDITLSLADTPAAQTCEITTANSFTNVSADISGIEIACNTVVSNLVPLTVNVSNYFNGDLIPSAEVSLSWEDNGVARQQSATSYDQK